MTGIKRNLEEKINHLLTMFPAILVIGARQAGKTTLVKQCRPDWRYFDLENPKDFDFISRDYGFFFQEYPEHLIIDEAQAQPELFNVLRGVIDANRQAKGRFILTGSSSPELLQKTADSLAGRIAIVEVGTLKVNETLEQPLPPFYELLTTPITRDSFTDLASDTISYTQYMNSFLQGGYPEPVLADQTEFHLAWMENYYKTYINRDIKTLFPRLDTIKYRRFIDTLSSLSGTLINKANIGRSLDTSEVTVRDYLDIANQTLLWRNLPAYEYSKSKSIVKMPKGIFRDSGLSHYLSGLHTREQLLRFDKVGSSFEAFVIEEIIKGLETLSIGRWQCWYYRTRNGAEVDLILEGIFGILPIEIKLATHTPLKQLNSLRKFLTDNGLSVGIVINNAERVEWLCEHVIQIPAHLL